MARVAPIPPAETDILCENCGYTLNGLPADANCPECGTPLQSSLGDGRNPPLWETPRGNAVRRFLQTTVEVIFRTTVFFRTSITRGDVFRARVFAHIHWLIASILFGIGAAQHVEIVGDSLGAIRALLSPPALILFAYGGLAVTTWAAAKLTAWEAAYRGLRLPRNVVSRGMYYHAAHYLPVAFLFCATVFGYVVMERKGILGASTLDAYHYVLAGEVIVAAVYLFQTYWIAMRNMMYANR